MSASATQTGATWGLDRIDQRDRPLSTTYTYDFDGTGVHAYIVDTGVRGSHVEFTGRMGNGFTSISDGNGTSDCAGHGTRGGETDKRCMMEARVNGRAPIAVTNFAPDQNLAFRGAADKLEHALDHAFGKLERREHRVRETIRREAETLENVAPPQS